MPKSERQKLKLLLLKDLLERQSNEAHPLSMQQLLEALEAEGIQAERKSIYSDIACLQDFGMDIVLTKGHGGGYYLGARPFELPELKLLVDAVQSSKFLSQKKTLELISKLEQLSNVHDASQLHRQVVVSGRIKTMNESVYYHVDRIHEAIAKDRQIRFRYFDWGPDRKKHYRRGLYRASPYALCWADENYYLIADSARHGITHYRVDKMDNLALSRTPRAVTEQSKSLDLARYTKAVFSMYNGQTTPVKMRFDNAIAGVVIDRFGRDAMLIPDGPDHFTLTADIAVSPVFLSWIIQFGGRAKILSPQPVVESCKNLLRTQLAQYET